MRHDQVPTGDPGGQHRFAGPESAILPDMQPHGSPPLENPRFQHVPLQPFQLVDVQRAPFQHEPFQRTMFQQAPPQHAPFQHEPFQRAEFQQAPPQRARYQQVPPQRAMFQHTTLQRPPSQHPDSSTVQLPWGYTYPAPLPASVPHQVMARPSGQAPPVERRVVTGEEERPAAAPTEVTQPERRYPNPWISKGGKLLLTLAVPIDVDLA